MLLYAVIIGKTEKVKKKQQSVLYATFKNNHTIWSGQLFQDAFCIASFFKTWKARQTRQHEYIININAKTELHLKKIKPDRGNVFGEWTTHLCTCGQEYGSIWSQLNKNERVVNSLHY